ncbi:hypothetical protein SCP_0100180 [Sparassis crispa]|uniref:Uncharacterized protein n=1 Tax=Sparassis crispa TaxID=139825 RepID=A0A401G4N2_9APHY|nr:hypothetical protein SCP_0100180 [Sparassis crispa]GBE77146.1 hypothetical protein SCP_0100180 [Sparassis crispa]
MQHLFGSSSFTSRVAWRMATEYRLRAVAVRLSASVVDRGDDGTKNVQAVRSTKLIVGDIAIRDIPSTTHRVVVPHLAQLAAQLPASPNLDPPRSAPDDSGGVVSQSGGGLRRCALGMGGRAVGPIF